MGCGFCGLCFSHHLTRGLDILLSNGKRSACLYLFVESSSKNFPLLSKRSSFHLGLLHSSRLGGSSLGTPSTLHPSTLGAPRIQSSGGVIGRGCGCSGAGGCGSSGGGGRLLGCGDALDHVVCYRLRKIQVGRESDARGVELPQPVLGFQWGLGKSESGSASSMATLLRGHPNANPDAQQPKTVQASCLTLKGPTD